MPRDIRINRIDWGKHRTWFALSISRLFAAGHYSATDERGISVLHQPDDQYRITVISKTEDRCAHAAAILLDRGELVELVEALAELAELNKQATS